MPINTLQYATLFQATLDKVMLQELTTGWMEPNGSMVKYNGGREVKIPKITTDGLGEYDRDAGFVQGSVGVAWETRSMTQDRGRTFQIDPMDVDETNFVPVVGNILGEFQRLHVVPEVDAYRYSKIASLAIAGSRSREYTAAAATILAELKADITAMQDATGVQAGDLIITMSHTIGSMLDQADKITRNITVSDFAQGGITLKVSSLDGTPIVRVPSARLKTAYLFRDGKTSGQTQGGFTPAAGAKDINWLITTRKAPIAISKTDVIRIFDPMTTQNANAWKIDFRKYHDLWILDNQLAGVFANVKGTGE